MRRAVTASALRRGGAQAVAQRQVAAQAVPGRGAQTVHQGAQRAKRKAGEYRRRQTSAAASVSRHKGQ
eukprot:1185908-Prymnesium_polylepis.1